jgi:UDP-N-acetylmuramoyl-L-alanyl-D-glutamate--2,6-diaminopimelate ligase
MNGDIINRVMPMAGLLRGLEGIDIAAGSADKMITSVEYSSNSVKKDSLFVAIEGYRSDGHRFIKDAAANGACAVVVSKNRIAEFSCIADKGITLIAASSGRKALSGLSAAFFGRPSSKLTVIGITGTNGKTSTTFMIESIMKKHGRVPAVIGTINYRWKGRVIPAPNTTPESRDIQELLYRMHEDGVDCVIMEVSSHGLEQHRF